LIIHVVLSLEIPAKHCHKPSAGKSKKAQTYSYLLKLPENLHKRKKQTSMRKSATRKIKI